MGKIKLTKNELKRQKDALKRYLRYLPTLLLKKQQLQVEISQQLELLEEKRKLMAEKIGQAEAWAGLLQEEGHDIDNWLKERKVSSGTKNIAGIDIPVFEGIEYGLVEYDLFASPLWVDAALESLRQIISLQEQTSLVEKGIEILKRELRVTTQRVNLFEKIKIPQTRDAISRIKIFISDQFTNAVGRSKIAKAKIEREFLAGALV